MKNAIELAKRISKKTFYDFDECKDLFEMAKMEDEWNCLEKAGIVPTDVPEKLTYTNWDSSEEVIEVERTEFFRLWQNGQIGGSCFDCDIFEDALFHAAKTLNVKII